MAKRIPALVEPPVLVWARETAGYSREEVAERLGKDADVLESWEEGADRPLMGQLRKLSEIYKRPLSDFYLPAPQKEKPIPHDFRREPGAVAMVYSPALRRQLRLAQERRELALALYADIGEAPPPAAKESITLTADPESIGLRVRELLGVEFEEQHRWGDGYDGYNAWRRRLEAIGILVFQFERVPPRETWGFSFVEEPLPVIGVNRALTANGRTFTMLHEFTHILLGESSICDIDDYTARGPEEMRTEVFCNHVAAAALMPRRLFLEHELVQENRAARDWNDDVIRGIAKTFGVSREAAVRRLLTFDLTDQAFYVRKRVQYIKEREEQRVREQKSTKDNAMKRNMPREAISNLGRNYVRLILQNYHEDRITLMDASEYLGVRAEKVRRVEELTNPW
jgi:Zn-dependent peptidase ImmA (M78 family)